MVCEVISQSRAHQENGARETLRFLFLEILIYESSVRVGPCKTRAGSLLKIELDNEISLERRWLASLDQVQVFDSNIQVSGAKFKVKDVMI